MRPDTSAKPPAGVNHVIILEYETHGKSFEASADSEYEDTCKIKQGHLGIVTRKEKPGDSNRNSINLDGGPQIFHVRPVFAVLNTKTLSLFDNEHVTNLYKAVTLDHVTHTQEEPELTLSKIWCFDVYRGPKKTEKTPQPLIQLCAETEEKMKTWANAIEIFDECEVKLQADDSTEDEENESAEVRQLKKNSIAAGDRKIKDLEDEANREEENRNKNKQASEEEMAKLRAKLADIRTNMKNKNIEEQRERLFLIEKRKKMAQLNKFLHEEEDCLTADLEKKAEASEVTSEGLIKLQEENQLGDILDGTNKDLMSAADKARLAITGQEVDLTEAERDMQERLKHLMVQETMVFDMIMDSSVCYDDDLFFNPMKHIQDTCAGFLEPGKIPDLMILKNCMIKENFCALCCDKLIGSAHEVDRLKCKEECALKMKGRGPVVSVPAKQKIKSFEEKTMANQIIKSYFEDQSAENEQIVEGASKKEKDFNPGKRDEFSPKSMNAPVKG